MNCTMEFKDKLTLDKRNEVAEAELESKREKTKWGAEISPSTE